MVDKIPQKLSSGFGNLAREALRELKGDDFLSSIRDTLLYPEKGTPEIQRK